MSSVTSGAGPRAVGTERGRWSWWWATPAPLTGLESPRRSSGRIKGGATTVEEERGPGLDLVCVLCAAVVREGLPLYFCVCLFVLLNLLNVRRFPPPSSRSTNCVTLVPKPGRKEGHAVRRSPRCWGGSRCWGGRAARRGGDRQWLPEAVVLER